MAANILAAKLSSCLLTNRACKAAVMTGAEMSRSMDSKTVQRPSPLSATQPLIPSKYGFSSRALAIKSSSQERTTLPDRQISAIWPRSSWNSSFAFRILNPLHRLASCRIRFRCGSFSQSDRHRRDLHVPSRRVFQEQEFPEAE